MPEETAIDRQLRMKVEFCGLKNLEQLSALRKRVRYPEVVENNLIGILAGYFTVEEWEELLKRAEQRMNEIKGVK